MEGRRERAVRMERRREREQLGQREGGRESS